MNCDNNSPLPTDDATAQSYVDQHCEIVPLDPKADVGIFRAFFNRTNRRFILTENLSQEDKKNGGVISSLALQTLDLMHPESVVMNYTIIAQPVGGNSTVKSGHITGLRVGDFTIDSEPINDPVAVLP